MWDGGIFQYTRAPFGKKGSGNSFVRAVQQFLYPIRDITASFVHSNEFDQHLRDFEKFLKVIKDSGFMLNIKMSFCTESSEIPRSYNWFRDPEAG